MKVIVLITIIGLVKALSTSNVGAIVQLFEWSWSDIASECENYLVNKGYKGVQISPPMEHIQGPQWWTRYQPVSYNLQSRSGSEAEFIDMVRRCDNVNITIIADAVINHMAAGSGVGTDGSQYGSRSYPIYSPGDFHHDEGNEMSNCEVDDYYDKYNVQHCDLVGLPDLSTGSSYVQDTLASYVNKMISYGIDGVRIDAAKHQDAGELQQVTQKFDDDIYIVTEVIGSDGEAVQPDEYYSIGQVTEFYYADYLGDSIKNENKMADLEDFGESWGLMPDKYALAFLDNHDTQRNGRAQLTYKDGDLYTLANIFMLAWDYGNIRVMSSYYFNDDDQGPPSVGVSGGNNCQDGKNWVCEHRWTAIANMVNWRNAAATSAVSNWVADSYNANRIAFSRGNAFIAINRDPSDTWTAVSLQTGLPEGFYCNVIVADKSEGCTEVIAVNSNGFALLSVPPMSAVAIHTNANKLF